MSRRFKNEVHICISRDGAPQCSYAGYNEHYEGAMKGKAFHVHLNADGSWKNTAWGPKDLCKEPAS